MADKKPQEFTVTDRRLFTSDGELRKDIAEEETPAPKASSAAAATPAPAQGDGGAAGAEEMPEAPSAAEQKQQADAYRQSAKELDSQVEASGHSTQELEMTFERFLVSLYMTAMLQLGMMHEEGGQPRIDLLGARQTIDTLGVLQEKTKGNLSSREENVLQNCLYELRMSYVEVTNALARGPEASEKGTGTR
jgi:Domain of unknown function (DUF1844)